jgi:cytosine/adenosine deaminase-related metal-dependent hydrolase
MKPVIKVRLFQFHSHSLSFHTFEIMAFKKFQADKIFTGVEMLDKKHVLITNEAGIVQEIISEDEAGENILQLNGILSPGFINCHCHLELSHLKGVIPKHTGLVDFVFKVVTQRHFPEDEIQDAIQKAENEMVQSGIVAVGDICNNLLTLAQKTKQKLYYHNFIEASGWLPNVADLRFERSKMFYDAFVKEIPSTSLVPHAPYSVSENLWQKLIPFFEKKITTIHNQETAFEDEFFNLGSGDFIRMYEMMKIENSFFSPTGKSSLRSYFHKMKDAEKVILVHNTFTTQEDIDYTQATTNIKSEIANLKSKNLFWCLCTNANQYIEKALPPVEMLRNNDCNIVIGTDSLASNDSLNILNELKTIHQNFANIPLGEMLQWATFNGAKALNIQHQFGSLQKGNSPGIVLIEHLENDHLSNRSTSKRVL